jgi:hypothetical protein
VIFHTSAISLFLNTFFPSLNPPLTQILSPNRRGNEHVSLPLADGLNWRFFQVLPSRTKTHETWPSSDLLGLVAPKS